MCFIQRAKENIFFYLSSEVKKRRISIYFCFVKTISTSIKSVLILAWMSKSIEHTHTHTSKNNKKFTLNHLLQESEIMLFSFHFMDFFIYEWKNALGSCFSVFFFFVHCVRAFHSQFDPYSIVLPTVHSLIHLCAAVVFCRKFAREYFIYKNI